MYETVVARAWPKRAVILNCTNTLTKVRPWRGGGRGELEKRQKRLYFGIFLRLCNGNSKKEGNMIFFFWTYLVYIAGDNGTLDRVRDGDCSSLLNAEQRHFQAQGRRLCLVVRLFTETPLCVLRTREMVMYGSTNTK